MKQIVINAKSGGFRLSQKAEIRLAELRNPGFDATEHGRPVFTQQPERDDPLLVQVVRELGEEANGACCKLKVVEVPDDVDWEIVEFDGSEFVVDKHRVWR